VKVNERRVKFNRNLAKTKRRVTKLGRFAESRGNSGKSHNPAIARRKVCRAKLSVD
jgi:hypothetical protein